MDLGVAHPLASWDALVLNVAAEGRTRLLLTEDLRPGFSWRGVRVVTPCSSRWIRCCRRFWRDAGQSEPGHSHDIRPPPSHLWEADGSTRLCTPIPWLSPAMTAP